MPTTRQYKRYRRQARKMRSKYAKRKISYSTISKIAKKVLMKNSETKIKDYSVGKVEYYHNSPQLLELNQSAALPTRGDGVDNRDGDKIQKIGTKHSMVLGNKLDRTNVIYCLTYITYPRDATYSYNTFFINKTGNAMLDRMNTDLVKIIKTIYIKPQKATLFTGNGQANGGAIEFTMVKKIWLPSKSVIRFPDGSTSEASNRKFGVLVTAYDAYGTLTTDNIAYVQHQISNYYKDT